MVAKEHDDEALQDTGGSYGRWGARRTWGTGKKWWRGILSRVWICDVCGDGDDACLVGDAEMAEEGGVWDRSHLEQAVASQYTSCFSTEKTYENVHDYWWAMRPRVAMRVWRRGGMFALDLQMRGLVLRRWMRRKRRCAKNKLFLLVGLLMAREWRTRSYFDGDVQSRLFGAFHQPFVTLFVADPFDGEIAREEPVVQDDGGIGRISHTELDLLRHDVLVIGSWNKYTTQDRDCWRGAWWMVGPFRWVRKWVRENINLG